MAHDTSTSIAGNFGNDSITFEGLVQRQREITHQQFKLEFRFGFRTYRLIMYMIIQEIEFLTV